MPPSRKKLLITGASGFLGWNLVQQASRDWQVFGTTFSQTLDASGFAPEQIDLRDFEALKQFFHRIAPDAVIHTAAVTDPNVCQVHRQESHQLNVTASANLAGLCSDRKIPFVFTSTDLVFDGKHAPYAEQDPVSPLSVYGEQKVAAETEILRRHPGAAICRLPLMFGDPGPVARSFLQPMLRNLSEGRILTLFTDEYRSPTSGASAARGLLMALKSGSGVLHLGGSERVSRYDFGLLVARVFGLNLDKINPCRQSDVKMPAPRPADVSLDSAKAFQLGFSPLSLVQELTQIRDQNGAFNRRIQYQSLK